MKMYKVKEEALDNWNLYTESGCDETIVVSRKEIKELAANGWGSERQLMREVEPLKHEVVKVERFYLGEYFVEVEEKNDPQVGLMWEAWIGKGRYGIKSYSVGVIANQMQAKEPHIYTHDEAIELIFVQIDNDIRCFEDDIEDIEFGAEERFAVESEETEHETD